MAERRTRSFSCTMEARVVEAFRGRWAPVAEPFADPGVALDFVRHLEPTYGPTVVRVQAFGGSDEERDAVEGEWFCDVGPNFGVNTRLRFPLWFYSTESERWSAGRGALLAWEECEEADWMLHAAPQYGVEAKEVVRAACGVARAVLPIVRARERHWAAAALDVAEAWTRDEATAAAVHFAQVAVTVDEFSDEPRDASYHAALAARRAAFCAWCADPSSSRIERMPRVAASVGRLAGEAQRWPGGRRRRQDLPGVVRSFIAPLALLRAAVAHGGG